MFERPATRFVAEFIGRTNLVDGVGAAEDLGVHDAVSLRVEDAKLTPGAHVSVSIRPHRIVIVSARQGMRPPGRADDNILKATVERVSFLGDAVDYLVRVEASDVTLRVSAPPLVRLAPGEPVTLAIAPESCVPLPSESS